MKYGFTVSGITAFPLDMLRYDCCYPLTQSDTNYISDSWTMPGKQHTVALVSDRKPTIARWESFGWSVSLRGV